MSGFYYALSLSAEGTDASHFCSIQPVPPLEVAQGGFSFAPTEAANTSVTIYPQVVQLQIPPSNLISGSVTVITNSPVIGGQLLVSPAANVPFTITAYGVGGKNLGSTTLPPGQTTVDFAFPVTASEAIPPNQVGEVVKGLLKN